VAFWVVRAGRYGEREDVALEQNIVTGGWLAMPDLTNIQAKPDIERIFREAYPERSKIISNQVGQLWAFHDRIQTGDLIALPLKKQPAIAIGTVSGPYTYRPDLPEDARHTRPVRWINKVLPRTAIDSDIRFSLGSSLTVFQVQRNDAEKRMRALISGKAPPTTHTPTTTLDTKEATGESVSDAMQDIEQYARDQITEHILRKFKGHGLANLVSEILKTQGYYTHVSPVGADGGVDIIAGRGPMGFDSPKLCIQVKSGQDPIDVKPLRELHGILKTFGADQGLMVAWGGYKDTALKEARQHFFQLRLWTSQELVEALLENYHKLPPGMQNDLPLKRIWALVPTETEA